MRLLFDTHALLWFLDGDPKFPRRWRTLRPGQTAECIISVLSYWEIGIKAALGKLKLTRSYDALPEEILVRGFQWLPIELSHCQEAARLPFHHRDPFDRLLVAQARVEGLTLLSGDPRLRVYDLKWTWH